MATTQTVLTIDQIKGPSGAQGELRIYQFPVRLDGTYATASKPTFDVLSTLKARRDPLISAVNVKKAFLLRDYYDGTNRYTAPNANIALSGSGNTTVTFRLDTTDGSHSNGDTNSEIGDGTALAGVLVIGVIASITGG